MNQFYNPAAFANPAPVATIGQTDFSPLGGGAQPGDRSAAAAARLRHRASSSGSRGQRQFEIRAEAFNLTNTPSFNLPGSLEFPRCPELRQHHLDAQRAAAVPARREGVLVTECDRSSRLSLRLIRELDAERPRRARDRRVAGRAVLPHSTPRARRSQPRPQPPDRGGPRAATRSRPCSGHPDSFEARHRARRLLSAAGQGAARPSRTCERARSDRPVALRQSATTWRVALLETGGWTTRGRRSSRLADAEGHGELHNLLGDIEERAGNLVAAAEEYQRAAHMDPDRRAPVRLGQQPAAAARLR